MDRKNFILSGWIILVLLTGCSTPPHAKLPKPRPLGGNLQTPAASHLPDKPSPLPGETQEPNEVITLCQALGLALLKNPELASFSWEVRAQEARSLQASLLPNPAIGMEVENLAGSGAHKKISTAESTIQLSQLLELGAKRSKRYRLSELERELAGWDYETKRLDVFTKTTIAFINLLAAQKRLQLEEEAFLLAEQVLNTVAARVKAGKVSPLEETKASVAFSTSRIRVETAKRNLTVAGKQLAALWGSREPSFERAEGNLAELTPPPPVESVYALVEQNPDIARWTTELQQRQAAVVLEKSKRIPDLSASAGVRRFEDGSDHAFVFGLSLPLPLIDRNQGGILEAQSLSAKAEEERKASEVSIYTAFTEAYEKLASSHAESLALKNKVLPAARQAFESAQKGYQEGKFGYLDLLDAERTFVEAKSRYVDALAEYQKSKANVERLIGQGLDDLGRGSASQSQEDQR